MKIWAVRQYIPSDSVFVDEILFTNKEQAETAYLKALQTIKNRWLAGGCEQFKEYNWNNIPVRSFEWHVTGDCDSGVALVEIECDNRTTLFL